MECFIKYGTILYIGYIMTMTQYITLLHVLTSILLSTSTPLNNNNFTTCKWPVLAALHNKEIIHYNNQEMTHMMRTNSKAMPINYNDYNYHITAVELV